MSREEFAIAFQNTAISRSYVFFSSFHNRQPTDSMIYSIHLKISDTHISNLQVLACRKRPFVSIPQKVIDFVDSAVSHTDNFIWTQVEFELQRGLFFYLFGFKSNLSIISFANAVRVESSNKSIIVGHSKRK